MVFHGKYIIGIVFICVMMCFVAPFAYGKSYDIYVDQDAGSGGDGSKSDPYDSINDAIEEAKSKSKGLRSIYVKKGEYDESITLSSNVKLYGESSSGVIIKKTVTMKDGTLLRSVTVSAGSLVGVLVSKNAEVEIKKSRIKNSRIGIKTSFGGGEVEVIGSKIYGNGKGIYVQAGGEIELMGSEIYDNMEEGVDIRDNVEGIIKNNAIHGNGESGIEVIIGKADLLISGNNIKNNDASGISTQYYEVANKGGSIIISGNSISNNGKYGIDCQQPGKGTPPVNYWRDSVTSKKNTISGNKNGATNGLCRFYDQKEVTQKESKSDEVDNKNDEEQKEENKENEEMISDEQIEKEKTDRDIRIKASLVQSDIRGGMIRVNEKIVAIQQRNSFIVFFIGLNGRTVDEVKKEINLITEKIEAMRTLEKADSFEGTKVILKDVILKYEEINKDYKKTLNREEKRPSLTTFPRMLFNLGKN